MNKTNVTELANKLFDHASPVIKINGIGKKLWLRDVKEDDHRRGPWHQGIFEVINLDAWKAKGACVYLVMGSDHEIRYVGISKKGLFERWRMCPSLDNISLLKLDDKNLFHSQFWKNLEIEVKKNTSLTFEVRVISAQKIADLHQQFPEITEEFIVEYGNDAYDAVCWIEKLFRNYRGSNFMAWNKI